jgi:hypothetical protein
MVLKDPNHGAEELPRDCVVFPEAGRRLLARMVWSATGLVIIAPTTEMVSPEMEMFAPAVKTEVDANPKMDWSGYTCCTIPKFTTTTVYVPGNA